jgi:hypothetical protein
MPVLALILWLQSAPVLLGETEWKPRTISEEMEIAVADLEPATWKWSFRNALIPAGCQYVSHEIELIEASPELSFDARNLIVDSLHSGTNDRPEGWEAVLLVGIAAYRNQTMGRGPASTRIRVRLTANCSDLAYVKLQEKFLISRLDFS